MNSENKYFKDFETVLQKTLEHYQAVGSEENVQVIFNDLNLFNEEKNDLERYEKSIKSHTRPLRIGFVGGFSTGKSSMINSLLGTELLGVKLEPATAQITELSYGEKFEVLEVTGEEDDYQYKKVSLDSYTESSTKRDNKSNTVSHYIIRCPSKNLSRFTIVDTPGFSSTSKKDDELTRKWVETLDLLIWIFDANKVGDKEEYDKLKELGTNVKVIGVINKIDLKSPGVRNKIKDEILGEEILDDVFFYSSKKVLDESKKKTSFSQNLNRLTSEIQKSVTNSKNFEINNTGSEITFKEADISKSFNLVPVKSNSYSEYYDLLINKIDYIRNNDINIILNNTLVNRHTDFRNLINDGLIENQTFFRNELDCLTHSIAHNNNLLQKSETVYQNINEDFKVKIASSFKVFYTSFFNKLGDSLFKKKVDSGIFSDDVYIRMIDASDEKVKKKIHTFIEGRFHAFLKTSFDIYEKNINNSVYKEFSKIAEIRNDKYHIINTIVNGLVASSIDSIIGYQRNFESYVTSSFPKSIEFHKSNIDLVVPDELLKRSINDLIIDDLISAYVTYNRSLKNKIEKDETEKEGVLEILSMIDKLL
ncbi:dynamin family protein [Tenacibaculum finnmarkense]|uniref:dynamin family protein n=1 Tax=Tenacibaculum finnmarkense TaxID=2781243 RepID=UPI001EFAE552|nr:dynamin family protein [Tenacibaculum finnmarkense]MCG8748644.1 hypothetical protein [Tenacibaculum finnmarkense]MCG8753458.1 hypothetical protein [Tenacibaculum finnmarkense]MCG8782299.1 hypothetical protein [Tenacibaculum finnmarkense]